jgi:hypothetical protein
MAITAIETFAPRVVSVAELHGLFDDLVLAGEPGREHQGV